MLKEVKLLSHVIKRNVEFGFIIEHMCVCVYIKNCLKCYMKCLRKNEDLLFSCVRLSWMCEMFWFSEQLLLFLPRPTSPNASWASDWRSCSRTEWWFGIRLEFLALVEEVVVGDKGDGVMLKWTVLKLKLKRLLLTEVVSMKIEMFFIFQNRISDFCFTSGFIFCFTILLLLPVKSTHLSGFGNDFL